MISGAMTMVFGGMTYVLGCMAAGFVLGMVGVVFYMGIRKGVG